MTNLNNLQTYKSKTIALILLATAFIFAFTFVQTTVQTTPPKLVKRKMCDEVVVKMPENFRIMTDEELAQKYFTYKKPTAMFTDERGKVNFGVNINDTEWDYKDLEMMKSFYKSSLMRTFTRVTYEKTGTNKEGEDIVKENRETSMTMLQEGIKTINKHRFIYFEFTSEVKPEQYEVKKDGSVRMYSYMLYTIHKEKALIINFSCPEVLKNQWQTVATEMMETVVLK